MADEMCYSDDTFGLKELYEQVNGGPGTSAVQPAVDGLGQLAPDFSGSSMRINSALRGTGATWQGQASTHAAGALSRVAEWADEGGQTARSGGTHVQSYASSFEYLKAHVPKPEPIPALSTFDKVRDFVGLQTDQAAAIQRNHDAAATAFQVLAAHEQTTDQAVAAFPQVNTVPTATAGADPLASPADAGTASGGSASGSGRSQGADAAAARPRAGGTSPASARDGAVGANGAGGGAAADSRGGGVQTHGAGSDDGTGGGAAGAGGGAGSRAGTGAGGGGVPNAGGSGWSPATEWTPLGPTSGGPSGTAPGGRGATPSGGGPSGGSPFSPGGSGSSPSQPGIGRGGAEASGRGTPEFAPRTGESAPRSAGGGAGGLGGPTGAARGGASPGGMSPMMGGTGGRGGGGDRQHRNTVFIPSDEPFAVEFDDVAPPVLGLSSEGDA